MGGIYSFSNYSRRLFVMQTNFITYGYSTYHDIFVLDTSKKLLKLKVQGPNDSKQNLIFHLTLI